MARGRAHEVTGARGWRVGERRPRAAPTAAAATYQSHGLRGGCRHGTGHHGEEGGAVEEEGLAERSGDSWTPRSAQKHVTRCPLEARDGQLTTAGCQGWRDEREEDKGKSVDSDGGRT